MKTVYQFRHIGIGKVFPHLECHDENTACKTASKILFPYDWVIEVSHDGHIAGSISVSKWMRELGHQ